MQIETERDRDRQRETGTDREKALDNFASDGRTNRQTDRQTLSFLELMSGLKKREYLRLSGSN